MTDQATTELVNQIRKELTDQVRDLSAIPPESVTLAVSTRSETLQMFLLGFVAETGVAPVDAILYERFDAEHGTWEWWFEKRDNQDSVIEQLRARCEELLNILKDKTGEDYTYLNTINAISGLSAEAQRISLSHLAGPMPAEEADRITEQLATGVRDDLAKSQA